MKGRREERARPVLPSAGRGQGGEGRGLTVARSSAWWAWCCSGGKRWARGEEQQPRAGSTQRDDEDDDEGAASSASRIPPVLPWPAQTDSRSHCQPTRPCPSLPAALADLAPLLPLLPLLSSTSAPAPTQHSHPLAILQQSDHWTRVSLQSRGTATRGPSPLSSLSLLRDPDAPPRSHRRPPRHPGGPRRRDLQLVRARRQHRRPRQPRARPRLL